MKWFLILFFLWSGILGSGLRVHPEVIPTLFQQEPPEDYCQIEFLTGRTLLAKRVRETEQTLEISLGSGTMVLAKSEIRTLRSLATQDVQNGLYPGLPFKKNGQEQKWLTWRYEDSLLRAAEQRAIFMAKEIFQNSKNNPAVKPADIVKSVSRINDSKLPEPPFAPMNAGGFPMPTTAARGLVDHGDKDQDYAALLKAGIDQLRQGKQ